MIATKQIRNKKERKTRQGWDSKEMLIAAGRAAVRVWR